MSFVLDSRADHLRLWFLSGKITLHLKLPRSIEIQSFKICGARKHLLFNIYVRPFTPCSCTYRNTWVRCAVTRSINEKKKENLFEAFQKVWLVCNITFATCVIQAAESFMESCFRQLFCFYKQRRHRRHEYGQNISASQPTKTILLSRIARTEAKKNKLCRHHALELLVSTANKINTTYCNELNFTLT